MNLTCKGNNSLKYLPSRINYFIQFLFFLRLEVKDLLDSIFEVIDVNVYK